MTYNNWYLKNLNTEFTGVFIKPNLFDHNICDSIFKSCITLPTSETTIVSRDGSLYKDDLVRKSEIRWIPTDKEHEWIYRTCTDIITAVNYEYFNYDLTYIEPLQFTKYDKNSFFKKHIDTLAHINQGMTRKISFSIQLSDSSDYSGCDLKLYNQENCINMPRNRGDSIFFNSNMLHEVTPIESGDRYSLIGWVNGPRFK
jgi:PKHD-type hydroxylase